MCGESNSENSFLKGYGIYLVLLGVPGAGKSTQGEQLSKQLNIPHISSGNLLREALHHKTELGLRFKSYIDKGLFVPDYVAVAMVRERLEKADTARGAILDGFPRTIAQAGSLSEILSQMGQQLTCVLYIKIDEEEVIRRLTGRLICSHCQKPYHIVSNPPLQQGVCDACGHKLYKRKDDKPTNIKERLRDYLVRTAPLIDYYRHAGLLVEINGHADIQLVTKSMLTAIRHLQTL